MKGGKRQVNKFKHQKQQLRIQMMGKRDALTIEQRTSESHAVCHKVINHMLLPLARKRGQLTLFSYVPYRSELDVRPMIEWAWQLGHRIVFPRVITEKNEMELRVVRSFEQMETSRWGILEPNDAAAVWTDSVDVVIVPGLAFDRTGARLGYGGGYYDRWFKQQYAQSSFDEMILLAPAFELQIVDNVPSEAHDVRVDVIITEKSHVLHKCQKKFDFSP